MTSTALKGIFRSLRMYHGDPTREVTMDKLYRQFLAPGDLAFDVGSHVGDRISSFRRLGARVVGLEPQPLAYRAIQLIHGRDPAVVVAQSACGDGPGSIRIYVNEANPTVSTSSADFIEASKGSLGWEGQQWQREIDVPCTTLDALIEQHGQPNFIKIDVEGAELLVLKGLSTPCPALSFEVTMIQLDLAAQCVARLRDLGDYRFNFSIGESHAFEFEAPVVAEEFTDYLLKLGPETNSGDVYAVLQR